MKETVANLSDVEKALSRVSIKNTAEGTNILIQDSAEAPLSGLRVFGKTTQGADPGPEYPQPLESVGDKGNVEVSIQGENPSDTAQTLTASTPNELPGIPVSSDGNYTDENGQQWICDEVDFTRGKYVQRIGKLDNTKWKRGVVASGTTGTRFIIPAEEPIKMQAVRNTPVFCTHYNQKNVSASYNVEGNYVSTDEAASNGRICIRTTHENMTTEEFVAWTEQVGMKTYYILANPIETDLSAEEIAAYAALHTFKPVTNIYNDEGAHMAVEYMADTKAYIDNKFAELQNAILSTGGNV